MFVGNKNSIDSRWIEMALADPSVHKWSNLSKLYFVDWSKQSAQFFLNFVKFFVSRKIAFNEWTLLLSW